MGACLVKTKSGDLAETDDPVVALPAVCLKRKPHEQPAVARNSTPEDLKKDVKEGGIGTSQFILEKTGRIHDVYSLDHRKIGEGAYGSVVRGMHKATTKVRAIKCIQKTEKLNRERIRKEISVMKLMDHPSIIKLYETFEDARCLYLVMELCTGGELFDKIMEEKHFSEADAAIVMKQILRAIFYMHEHSICHRDLKPENFLFLNSDPIHKNVLKLIDFGLSCHTKSGELMKTRAGTPYYVAPQVLMGGYDKMCDIWSCGVIMYITLCGYPPFYGRSDAEVLSKVRLGRVRLHGRDWRDISGEAKDLIQHMLEVSPRERYTAQEALNHAWIRQKAPSATGASLQHSLLDNLRDFTSQNRFMKAALTVIAGQLSDYQIQNLREAFIKLDGNGDGLLTQREMAEGLHQAGIEELPSDMKDIVEGVDADGSGQIDYTEFVAASLERKHYLQEDVCWCAFEVFDINQDGKITLDELKEVLNSKGVEESLGTETTKDLLSEVDRNGDGSIDFQEFMGMMHGAKPASQTSTPQEYPRTRCVQAHL